MTAAATEIAPRFPSQGKFNFARDIDAEFDEAAEPAIEIICQIIKELGVHSRALLNCHEHMDKRHALARIAHLGKDLAKAVAKIG